MGRTKRAAELIVAAAPDLHRGSIRLGNVLGSEGSVWTSFVEQIRTGQLPVTITHPEAYRYFVAASEAVDFILRAVSLVSQGEILVPHMGEPVRIADFARRLGAVMGNRNIEMRVIGLRPGDKLLEDLKDAETDFVSSSDAGLRMIREGAGSWAEVESWIARLLKMRDGGAGCDERVGDGSRNSQNISLLLQLGISRRGSYPMPKCLPVGTLSSMSRVLFLTCAAALSLRTRRRPSRFFLAPFQPSKFRSPRFRSPQASCCYSVPSAWDSPLDGGLRASGSASHGPGAARYASFLSRNLLGR